MKKKQLRKSSALLAAGAGAAVCLSGGGAQALGVSGNIVESNGKTSFAQGNSLKACNSAARWLLTSLSGSGAFAFSFSAGSGLLNENAGYIRTHAAGVTVSAGMSGGFTDLLHIPNGVSDIYFAVEYGFLGGGVRYGWLHVNSTTANTISLDKWGYENTGASITTLADSVTTARKLGLADGRTQLRWTNANEEGVARYEVQAKDASGVWNAVSSEVPGAGMYSIAVPKGAQCRVVVEKVDGTAENIAF